MAEWEPTSTRFVAFLDIMGFKDMVFRNKHEEVLKTIETFKTATIDTINDIARIRLSQDKKEEKLRYTLKKLFGESIIKTVFFSDSILLISNDDSADSAEQLIINISIMLKEALAAGIPLKGAIAHGKQTADFDRSLHFGKPLIDAYELQNELHLYSVALHHSAEQHLIDIGIIDRFEKDYLYKYKTPLKGGKKVKHYLVALEGDLLKSENLKSTSSKLYSTVSGHTRLYVDHTLEFLESLAEERAKQSQPTIKVPRNQ